MSYFKRLCLGIRHSDSGAQMLYWTRALCDRGRLHDSEIKFLTNAYTNPKTLTAGILTLNDRHDVFESFCAPVFLWFYTELFSFGIRNFRTPRHFDIKMYEIGLFVYCYHYGPLPSLFDKIFS